MSDSTYDRRASRVTSSTTGGSLVSSGGSDGLSSSIFRTSVSSGSQSQQPPPPPPVAVSPAVDRKSTNFFRFNSRNDDYRSDATNITESRSLPSNQQSHHHHHQPSFHNSRSSAGDNPIMPFPEEKPKTRMQRCCKSFKSAFRPSRAALDRMTQLLDSRIWQVVLVVNTILLLFGSAFQDLCIPKEADLAFDILLTMALVVFITDGVIRLYVEPGYFGFQFCGRGTTQQEGPSAWGAFHFGSFMFWCDLISTCTLMYDISYINPKHFEINKIGIQLNRFGMPSDGLDEINHSIPIELEMELLLTIGRTARVARFIRASTVVKTRSTVNWYWLFQTMNPLWYWEGYIQRRRDKKLAANASPELNGTEIPTSVARPLSNSRNKGLVRRSSWGGVGLTVLAATRSMEKEQEESGLIGAGRQALRFVGWLRNDNDELRRQIAATKIQRIWRATCHGHKEHATSPDDVAWVSNRINETPMDQIMHAKESTVKPYNIRNLRKKTLIPPRRSVIPKSVKNSIRSSGASGRRRPESQVGSAMRELTGQRVAIGIIVALVLTVLFTYTEDDATRPSTMIVLHNQTANPTFANDALNAARNSSIPGLYEYVFANRSNATFSLTGQTNPNDLRQQEKLRIIVSDMSGNSTVGYFIYRSEVKNEAWVEIFSTIFILLVWFFGVTAFAGPVMTLVVVPIERMVRLLGMLMLDPLGYQSTPRYKKFVAEEHELTRNTRWTKEVLKGMETSFLMSTILRIGSLMKVGFGSAGVEIIRNNLERGQSKNMLILNSQGSTVSCIFLFCDIRQFTDATECLQEEVFVFTNRIAAVVHSICHSYGGSANKNIGDAFLLSWLLEDEAPTKTSKKGVNLNRGMRSSDTKGVNGSNGVDTFTAKNNQADKALYSVVRVSMALHHDKYYIETMSETARDALLTKLSKRKGPVVQMGFGLHAGKAVQGAIGSQRKIDATYVSESVERAEFLESATKKYGLKMLMSDSFHRLLHPTSKRRCRKIDQIRLRNEDDDDDEAVYDGDVMELFTFDMDIDALWKSTPKIAKPTAGENLESGSDTSSINNDKVSKRDLLRPQASARHLSAGGLLKGPRRRSMTRIKTVVGGAGSDGSEEFKNGNMSATEAAAAAVIAGVNSGVIDLSDEAAAGPMPPELVLPTGPALYNANVWKSDDMRRIRQLYSDGLFFQKFNAGFLSYYARDWEHAKQCFQSILERFDDGPSRYFLSCIQENNGVPPRNFLGYGTA